MAIFNNYVSLPEGKILEVSSLIRRISELSRRVTSRPLRHHPENLPVRISHGGHRSGGEGDCWDCWNGVPWNWMKQAIPIKTVVRLYNPMCIYIYMCVYIYTHNNTSTPPGTLGIAHQKFPFSKSLTRDGFDLKEIFNSNRSSECFELSYCRFTFPKNNVHFKRTFIF